MKLYERVSVFLAVLLYLVVACLLVAALIDGGVRASLSAAIEDLSSTHLWPSLVIALICVLASIVLVRSMLEREPDERVVATSTDIGRINISMKAIENAVRRVAREVKGVRESSTRVDGDADGLIVTVDVSVASDESIPAVSQQVQVALRDHLSELVGVPVKEIHINVKDTSGASRSRVAQ
ncbi:MAG: alkaline shock response membrane anchor protein AmaP [Bacillota bacterium]|jgi:uncharacterized alkaline shock family protein YloU|nr:alkaline shock response membrane anchor protein AmaP [Bacillota bacterium]HOB91252.1 alkaline shock response membrane anchor protein AmaP [Bacillota bacterium]HPZ53657.1 alkaline shock response membrane anchor protein AmaP [Bacillota bacterium]HQD17218.1 alkaline shock response membrane anchor protein AmaP [Bacillota bacterium]